MPILHTVAYHAGQARDEACPEQAAHNQIAPQAHLTLPGSVPFPSSGSTGNGMVLPDSLSAVCCCSSQAICAIVPIHFRPASAIL